MSSMSQSRSARSGGNAVFMEASQMPVETRAAGLTAVTAQEIAFYHECTTATAKRMSSRHGGRNDLRVCGGQGGYGDRGGGPHEEPRGVVVSSSPVHRIHPLTPLAGTPPNVGSRLSLPLSPSSFNACLNVACAFPLSRFSSLCPSPTSRTGASLRINPAHERVHQTRWRPLLPAVF
jgi:hypothetical protein